MMTIRSEDFNPIYRGGGGTDGYFLHFSYILLHVHGLVTDYEAVEQQLPDGRQIPQFLG